MRKSVGFRLHPHLKAFLSELAKREDLSQAAWVAQVIRHEHRHWKETRGLSKRSSHRPDLWLIQDRKLEPESRKLGDRKKTYQLWLHPMVVEMFDELADAADCPRGHLVARWVRAEAEKAGMGPGKRKEKA